MKGYDIASSFTFYNNIVCGKLSDHFHRQVFVHINTFLWRLSYSELELFTAKTIFASINIFFLIRPRRMLRFLSHCNALHNYDVTLYFMKFTSVFKPFFLVPGCGTSSSKLYASSHRKLVVFCINKLGRFINKNQLLRASDCEIHF